MEQFANRLRLRVDELGLSHADAARACGCTPARFGNYISGTRKPDLDMLARIAITLKTTTDWLLGLSGDAPNVDAKPVIRRLLELDGIPAERANVIAEAAQEALSLLSSLPDVGAGPARALLAAQAAWQMRPSAKPS